MYDHFLIVKESDSANTYLSTNYPGDARAGMLKLPCSSCGSLIVKVIVIGQLQCANTASSVPQHYSLWDLICAAIT